MWLTHRKVRKDRKDVVALTSRPLRCNIAGKCLITYGYNVIIMESVQIRIGDEYINILKELSETLHSSRSEVIRRVMEEGIKDVRMKIAMEKYLDEEFSLCRAAEFADVSIQQMAKYLTQKGIPFFKQSVEETMRDAQEAEGWLNDADIN